MHRKLAICSTVMAALAFAPVGCDDKKKDEKKDEGKKDEAKKDVAAKEEAKQEGAEREEGGW